MTEKPRIVFFGTPDFAVPSLKALVSNGYRVVAVVTSPDKPAGRGLKERASAVKECALGYSLPVLQPINLKDPDFYNQLNALQPDLQIIIAFRMLPRQIWSLPPMGTFNLHASLLPRYRGAAPIQRAVMNGEQTTGLTTFFLNDQIDTGKIILSAETEIGPDETAGELYDRLKIMGADLVLKTVGQIVAGTAIEKDQALIEPNQESLPKAPKIFREDCRIDWNQPVVKVVNIIRGLSPYPGAFTVLTTVNGESTDMKIFKAKPVAIPVEPRPGFIGIFEEKAIVAATLDGWIQIFTLQIPGRKVMDYQEFLRGYAHTLPKLL